MPERIGRYRVLGHIGHGGFGTVYEAEQEEPVRRRVALKVVRHGVGSAQVLARFEAERQALAVMDHPGIAKFLDADMTPEGQPYFVMEYVRGVPITEFCEAERLSLEERVGLVIQACHAVQHAHGKGVIHRDIKPSNVLVELVDGKPLVKVIDFGVAKALAQPLSVSPVYTERGEIIGTPEYMSPEQARGAGVDVDTRSDVYSLGAVLYELLTGVPPFDSESLRGGGYADLQRVLEESEPVRPSTRVSTLTLSGALPRSLGDDAPTLSRRLRGDLDWVAMKCLEKERNRRYDTASALAMELQRYLADEPVLAGPPTLRYRASKFIRRHRTSVAAASVVVLALLTGLAVASSALVRARREAERATQAAERARQAEQRALALSDIVRSGTASLAVLPLENASHDPDEEFFAEGTTSTLIASLSSVHALRVVSDSSVRHYKGSDAPLADIAKELQVDGILTGEASRSGDDVRIVLRLVHPLVSQSLWSATFEDRLRYITSLQGRVVRAVADALRLDLTLDEHELLGKARPVNPEAHLAYLRGQHALQARDEASIMTAMRHFGEAIELDSSYALPHAGMADAYLALLDVYRAPKETMPQARAAALQALHRDADLPEAHVSLGLVLYRFDWDWEAARREFEEALRLNPSLASAHLGMSEYLRGWLRHDEALEAADRALRLDPLLLVSDQIYWAAYDTRHFDLVEERASRGLAIDPDAHLVLQVRGLARAELGNFEGAIADLERAREIDDNPMAVEFLGGVYARAGRPDDARAMLAELERQAEYRYLCPYEVATIYIALGEIDEAFRWMDRAIDDQSSCIPNLLSDARLDPIRDDPRFHDLLIAANRLPPDE